MSIAGGGGSALIEQAVGGVTLTNVDNIIQGAGVIGNGGLTLVNKATINANWSGQALTLNGSGGITNTGLLEATSGGFLQISATTVNNAGGNITANSGSTVQLLGSAVIQGGDSLNNNGGTLGTPVNSVAYLDGSTGAGAITVNGTYTSDLNTDTYLLGTINSYKDNILLNGGGGANAILLPDSTNVTLQGGGTVILSTASGGGNAYIEQAVGGVTLTNVDNTIQGAGVIGNGGLTLVNNATINANSSGQTLTLNGSGGITNTGLMEATSGGFLQIGGATVNNAGGNITANSGGAVQLLDSALIQGGTLNIDGTLSAPGGVAVDGGLLKGTGTVAGNVSNGGVVSPGDSPGTLHMVGNYCARQRWRARYRDRQPLLVRSVNSVGCCRSSTAH